MRHHSLYEWFASSVRDHPDNLAIDLGTDTLTYAELEAAVARVAELIRATHGSRPHRVGLISVRHLPGYLTYLAILRLGATVVPMNPANPAARNISITREAGLDLTVLDDSSGEGTDEYRVDAGVSILDLTGDDWRACLDGDTSVEVPAVAVPDPDDVAYIIFTSGTTGRPKGVPVTHANVSAFLTELHARYRFTPTSRAPQTFELCFDASILSMFGTWGAGAALFVADRGNILAPVKFINAKQLTHWLSVPSLIMFAKQLRALSANSMPSLRLSSFGGEALTAEHIEAWTKAAPNTAIINCYGPTETTVVVTANELPADPADRLVTSNRSAPIGAIFGNLQYLVLDEDLRPTDDGELVLRGTQRFPGYLDPADNAGRFVVFDDGDAPHGRIYDGTEPLTAEHWYRTGDRVTVESGQLVHQGRVDLQVKVLGNRVELSEIENSLRRHPSVVDLVVVPIPGRDGNVDLRTFYTGDELPDDELADQVADLPPYMHPQSYHRVTALPLTGNDKVDRRKLVDDYLAA